MFSAGNCNLLYIKNICIYVHNFLFSSSHKNVTLWYMIFWFIFFMCHSVFIATHLILFWRKHWIGEFVKGSFLFSSGWNIPVPRPNCYLCKNTFICLFTTYVKINFKMFSSWEPLIHDLKFCVTIVHHKSELLAQLLYLILSMHMSAFNSILYS